MADFHYKAARADGRLSEGSINAQSQMLAIRQLRQQGLTPLKVVAANGAESTAGAGKRRVKKPYVLAMTSELAVLLRAGLPIDRALAVLIEMNQNPDETQMLNQILEGVKRGGSFSQALQPFEPVVGRFYINMIRSGEASGTLSTALERLVAYLENARQVRSSVVSALIYPAILLVVATLSVVLMLGFVVPQFETLFNDMGDALPLLTRWVISAGKFIQAYGWLLLILVALLVFGLRYWLASEAGIAWKDRTLIRLPLLGAVLFKYEMAKFSRTLGTLNGGGVSLMESIRIATDTVGNSQVRQALSVLEPAVKRGESMSSALRQQGGFTPMVVQIVRVGEESGKLDQMMLELSAVYDDEVKSGVKRGLTLLEPLLILAMGGAIALIIIAILMGILSVNDLAM